MDTRRSMLQWCSNNFSSSGGMVLILFSFSYRRELKGQMREMVVVKNMEAEANFEQRTRLKTSIEVFRIYSIKTFT